MERPLDLSGREEDRDGFPNRDEPICQVVNCHCPLKHIMQLDGPSSPPKNNIMSIPELNVPDASYSSFPPYNSSSQYKRPLENSRNEQSQLRKRKLKGDQHVAGTEWNDQNGSETPFHRERSKSATFVPTHPKKRAYVRRYSPEPSAECPSANHSTTQWSNEFSSPTQAVSNSHEFVKPSLNVKRNASNVGVKNGESEKSCKSSINDVSALKADLIREIDNEKDEDEEDIGEFRKRLFDSYLNVREKIKSLHKNDKKVPESQTKEEQTPAKESAMASLDYMISKTLMQNEDKPFKPRNNHIHEIIRGEKSGRLCLMDLVELQVEIGLA